MARQRSDERPKSRAKTLPEKQLSPSEWRIMQSCWKLGRTTIRDILLDIADRPPARSYTTVHMLLTRIVEKGYLAGEDFVDNILDGEAKNLEILNEVLAERKVKRPRGKKAN